MIENRSVGGSIPPLSTSSCSQMFAVVRNVCKNNQITDALILWALEGTDPDKNTFMTEKDIIDKVEDVIPTAKQFFRGAVESRLKVLTKKEDGSRNVNVYVKAGTYCLPYDSRQVLANHAIEDESLTRIIRDVAIIRWKP